MVDNSETIFALSTARGRAAVAVIRISGPASSSVLGSLTGGSHAARRATLATIKNPKTQETVDKGLVLWLPGPRSFTGEDMAEFHVHGGSAVVEATINILQDFPSCRLALPGEFTRRAFENGRFDLTAAEGIADLIDADTEGQRRQAIFQANGGLAVKIESWKNRLALQLAHLEALIDFSDDDVPEGVFEKARQISQTILNEIKGELGAAKRGEIIREGASVAIIGPPNSGKSSLLNALAGRDVAIVSPHAGTTRDVLEVNLNISGFSVRLADTAGIRESTDPIESEGVRRARTQADVADVKVVLLDSTHPEEEEDFLTLIDDQSIKVWNKSDLAIGPNSVSISSKTGEGIGDFLALLETKVLELVNGPPALITRARHRVALQTCLFHLSQVLGTKDEESEIVAEELRLAVRALGSVTNAVGIEDLLDLIFRDFCIGK